MASPYVNWILLCYQIARFKRQRAAESKLLEIKERRERRGRSTRAAALSTPVEAGEEDILDDDGEEEREVSHHPYTLERYISNLSLGLHLIVPNLLLMFSTT